MLRNQAQRPIEALQMGGIDQCEGQSELTETAGQKCITSTSINDQGGSVDEWSCVAMLIEHHGKRAAAGRVRSRWW